MSGFPELGSYDGLGLAELVRKDEVRPIELVEEVIRRIERINPEINAVVTRMYAAARTAAEAAIPDGPFRGVPILIKDLGAAVAGARLTMGSRFFASYVPSEDSEIIKRYRRAGLLPLAKTNTPEFGCTPTTEPELHGATKNPWDPTRTAGGSSGGSAAAVAARLAPIAHGGDGGGSIRIPASCCGVFGLKPTRGRTPLGPHASEGWQGFSIDHALTLSVRDSAALLDASQGEDLAPWYGAPRERGPFLPEVAREPGRLRVAFTTRPLFPGNVHRDCVAAVSDVAGLLESMGHQIEETTLDIGEGVARAYFLIVAAEAAADVAMGEKLLGRTAKPRDFEADTWILKLIAEETRGSELAIARRVIQAASRHVQTALAPFDVLLTPTLGAPPVPLGTLGASGVEAWLHQTVANANLRSVLAVPGLVDAAVARVYSFIPFTAVPNITGQPSMSVPLVWNREGLPVGTMFTARFGDEATLFRLAGALERARPWRDRRPRICA